MKKILLGALGVVIVGVLGVVVAASMQPDTMEVERSVTVAAAPTDVFPYADDFTKWQQWNPWKDRDPSQVETFSEQPSGVGAWYAWKGNDDVGQGKMATTESVPNEKVVWDLHFIEPFESKAVVTLSMAPDGDGTKVTWGFVSENDFMTKVFCLFVDMDAMLGADFEKGLDRMKPLVEAEAKKRVEAEQAAAASVDGVAPDAAAAAGGTYLEGQAPQDGDPAAHAAK